MGILIVMNTQPLFTPLTKDGLVDFRGHQTRAHPRHSVEKLLGAGYVQQSVSGLALTDLGVRRLDRERVKKEPN